MDEEKKIIVDDIEIFTDDNKLDSIIAENIEYSIELSDRVMYDIKIGKMIREIIEYALTGVKIENLENDTFIVLNKQLNIVLIGDKLNNKITVEMVEWLDNFKIFGL